MDTTAKLIICVILGAFYAPTVSAYQFTDPYPNVKVIDGELHLQRPGGGTTLAYPNAGISKEIPVSTSKGNFLVPVEKTLPISTAKVGKAATRFLKTLPVIGTGLAIYDTVCELTDICKNGDQLMSYTDQYGQPFEVSTGYWSGSSGCPSTRVSSPSASCQLSTVCVAGIYGSSAYLKAVEQVTSSQYKCINEAKPPGQNPITLSNVFVNYSNTGTCLSGYTKVGNKCQLDNAVPRPVTESDWTTAETKLNAQPQQTATALYNSDAPVPVLASTQSAPVTQQIAQTSTQTKDAQGNITGTQVATTSVKVEDTSTTNNVTYNVTEVTTITTYNENNEITNTQTSTADNSPPKTGTDETTISFDDVPPAQLEEEAPEFDLFSPVSWGEGTCPPDETLDLSLTSLTISWEPTCNVAEQIRPILILFASIAAMYIVSGVSRQ